MSQHWLVSMIDSSDGLLMNVMFPVHADPLCSLIPSLFFPITFFLYLLLISLYLSVLSFLLFTVMSSLHFPLSHHLTHNLTSSLLCIFCFVLPPLSPPAFILLQLLPTGGDRFASASSSVLKSSTVSTEHAGDIHLATPTAYYEQALSPPHRSQPVQETSRNQTRQEAEMLPVAQGEMLMGMGKRKHPSPESIKQTPQTQPDGEWEEPKGYNMELVTPHDLSETDGKHKSKAAISGRGITFLLDFVCLFLVEIKCGSIK